MYVSLSLSIYIYIHTCVYIYIYDIHICIYVYICIYHTVYCMYIVQLLTNFNFRKTKHLECLTHILPEGVPGGYSRFVLNHSW